MVLLKSADCNFQIDGKGMDDCNGCFLFQFRSFNYDKGSPLNTVIGNKYLVYLFIQLSPVFNSYVLLMIKFFYTR